MFVCVCMCIHASVCKFVYVYMCMHVCMYRYVCICMYLYRYVCLYLCMCQRVFCELIMYNERIQNISNINPKLEGDNVNAFSVNAYIYIHIYMYI